MRRVPEKPGTARVSVYAQGRRRTPDPDPAVTSKPVRSAVALLLCCAPFAVSGAPAGTSPTASPEAAAGAVPASVERVLRVSIGADGTVASVVTLAGPGADEAVVLRRGDASTLVARTGRAVTSVDGHRFVPRAIGRAWTAGGAVAWLGTTREGPPVLVLRGPDGEGGDRLVAVGADPDGALVGEGVRPVVGAAGCTVELEVFELLDAGAAPLAEDGSVSFPAWLDGPCAGTRARVRYRNGTWALESVTVAPAVVAEPAIPDTDLLPPARADGEPTAPIDLADGADGADGTDGPRVPAGRP